MSKNFNLLYGFIALLLQFFLATSSADTKGAGIKQRNDLIAQYGLVDSMPFQQPCQKITAALEIPSSCLLLNQNNINAYAFADGHIMITLGLLLKTQNPDQLAHVLAHEQAHITLNHHQSLAEFMRKPPVFFPKKKLKKLRLKQEKQADQMANNQIIKAGYDPAQIHHLWQSLLNKEDSKKWSDHQKLSQRIDKHLLNQALIKSPEWQAMIHDLSQR